MLVVSVAKYYVS